MFPKSPTPSTAGQCSNETILIGENYGDESGYSVSSIGDLNGDGIPEVLIGAPGYPKNYQGATYVVSGANINLNAGGSFSIAPAPGIVRFIGENNKDFLGGSVSSIGDLNGDGIPELLIGAINYPSGNGQGATYVVSGASINLNAGGSFSIAPAPGIVMFVGENNGDQSGFSVNNIGDLNGDGIPELLIGAPYYPSGNLQGATYVVSGASINLNAGGSISLTGWSTAGNGIVRFVGENSGDFSGYSVSSIGDLNGDGIPELLIGADAYSYAQGATYVVSGASINLNTGGSFSIAPAPGIVRFAGENPRDFSGYSVSSIGDLNGDGIPELLIGVPYYSNGNELGATYVVSGASINLNAGGSFSLTPVTGIVRFVGENDGDQSGTSVSSIGGLNEDGIPDLLIGAEGYLNGTDQGATYVVSGASINLNAGGSFSLTPVTGSIDRLVGESNNDYFGASVSSTGYLNGDGIPELLIGAPFYPSGTSKGATYVVSGAALGSCLSNLPEEVFSVNEVHQPRIVDEINTDGIQLHIRDTENADTQLHRAIRNTDDDSFSLKTQPMWHDLPIIHAAQIPLIQTGVHLIKQGYNKIINWWQSDSKVEQTTEAPKLIPVEQVAEALTGYNNVSQKLEHIIEQLEPVTLTNKDLLSWLKKSLLEHKVLGQQLLDKPVIMQELLASYFENVKVLTKDLNEFVKQQGGDNLVLSYIKAGLAGTNQALENLSQVQLDTVKNIEMLNDLPAQTQADNMQPILCADAGNLPTNNITDYLVDSSLLIGEVPLLLG
ncbi:MULTISPECIES: hypothetical protein [unclassified Rickettsia]|uniref:hypothetical protein n=1 Tax=unclassified Rickettsia TaxID=114295 RepID=UPI0031330B4A